MAGRRVSANALGPRRRSLRPRAVYHPRADAPGSRPRTAPRSATATAACDASRTARHARAPPPMPCTGAHGSLIRWAGYGRRWRPEALASPVIHGLRSPVLKASEAASAAGQCPSPRPIHVRFAATVPIRRPCRPPAACAARCAQPGSAGSSTLSAPSGSATQSQRHTVSQRSSWSGRRWRKGGGGHHGP